MDFRIPNPFFSYDNITIKNVLTEKTLGTTIDNKLTFKNHFENICKKANQKLNALARITKFTSPFQRIFFVKSQFSCCPLIWMFTSKGLDKKINRIHEKSLISFKWPSIYIRWNAWHIKWKDNSPTMHWPVCWAKYINF